MGELARKGDKCARTNGAKQFMPTGYREAACPCDNEYLVQKCKDINVWKCGGLEVFVQSYTKVRYHP